LPIYFNPQGTLESEPNRDAPGYYLTTSWIGDQLGGGRSIATWLEVVAAPNAAEAMDIVRDCPLPTLCWVFADRQGHIGMQANGWFPASRAQRAVSDSGLGRTITAQRLSPGAARVYVRPRVCGRPTRISISRAGRCW
jgi:acyl-homoserine lactone acylase PvdQ